MELGFAKFAIRRVLSAVVSVFLSLIMLGNCLACGITSNVGRTSLCCSHSHKSNCGDSDSRPSSDGLPACGAPTVQPYSEARPAVALSNFHLMPVASAVYGGSRFEDSAARRWNASWNSSTRGHAALSDPSPLSVLRI